MIPSLKALVGVVPLFAVTPAVAQSASALDGGGRPTTESRCAADDSLCLALHDRLCRASGGHSRIRAHRGALVLACIDGPAAIAAATPPSRMCTPANPVCSCSGNLSGGYGSVHVCMVNAFTSCIGAGGSMSGGIIPDGPDSGTFIGTCVPRP